MDADDRTTAILMPGIDFLKSLGLWDALNASATPLVTMELIDGGQNYLFDAAEIGHAMFGYNINNAALKKALVQNLQNNSLVTWHEENAQSLNRTEQGWELLLASGKRISSDLLIGADGRNSPTRKAARIPHNEKNIEQAALVSVLQSGKPHHNVTLEWFRQGGPFTLVPVERNKFALVWCDDPEILQAKTKLDLPQLEQELTAMTLQRFGELKIISRLQIWTVQPMHALKLVSDGCALIGEAAHVLPPIGAQGFNITLHDIIALAGILAESRDIGLNFTNAAQLSRYQHLRLGDIMARYHSVNALNALLHRNSLVLRGLRRASLFGLQRTGFVKKYLMHLGLRHAA